MSPPVVVITLNTDRSSVNLDNWVSTAERYGYTYHVLGRGEHFKGWPWRTRMYIDAIRRRVSSRSAVVVLCDSGDLFFVAGPDHLLRNFLQYGRDVVIGSEAYCCTGTFNDPQERPEVVRKTLALSPHSRYAFPNGGFAVGRRDALLRVLRANLREEDDQVGYHKQYLEGKIALDWKHSLVGNVNPNSVWYRPLQHDDDNHGGDELDQHWRFDEKQRRWFNVHSNETPAAFHVPGRNWSAYNRIAKRMFDSTEQVKDSAVDRIVLPNARRMPLVTGEWTVSSTILLVTVLILVGVSAALAVILVFIAKDHSLK